MRGGKSMKWLKLALKVVIFTLTLLVEEVLDGGKQGFAR